MTRRKIAVAYIPVLHQGYLAYLKDLEKEGVHELFLVSDEILGAHEELDYVHRKDRIRAVPHEVMKEVLKQCTSLTVESLNDESISRLQEEIPEIQAPREDVNEFIMQTYFEKHPVQYKNVFLRWNKSNLGEHTEPEGEAITLPEFESEVLAQVSSEGMKSGDWWRQVGAALIKEGKVLAITHNAQLPDEELPNAFGDARSLFKKGININYVTTAHAEAAAIATAAKEGMSTEGATLITTDFPCPYCARIIAKSGIKKIYYKKGYAILGGDDFFRDMGIEAIKVKGK